MNNDIRVFLPKTDEYIDSVSSENRRGHHNYVATREILNARIPVLDMSIKELKAFDLKVRDRLEWLDDE